MIITLDAKVIDTKKDNQTNKIKIACEKENAEACFKLGVLYHNGSSVEKDMDKAFDLFHKSCDLGNMKVCTRLALTYENNESERYDINKSLKLYEMACKGQDVRGCEGL